MPPVAFSVALYAVEARPPGSIEVLTARLGVTVMDRALVVDCGVGVVLSVACTVKFEVPAVVGDPEMEPLEASDSPAGREPEARDHV